MSLPQRYNGEGGGGQVGKKIMANSCEWGEEEEEGGRWEMKGAEQWGC